MVRRQLELSQAGGLVLAVEEVEHLVALLDCLWVGLGLPATAGVDQLVVLLSRLGAAADLTATAEVDAPRALLYHRFLGTLEQQEDAQIPSPPACCGSYA